MGRLPPRPVPPTVLVFLLLAAAGLAPACASNGRVVAPGTGGSPEGDGGTGGPDSGGTRGGGGTGGSPAGAAADAATDAPGTVSDGPPSAADAGGDSLIVLDDPSTWPGGAYNKPFIVACPEGASRAACCQHYCACMATNCGAVSSVKLPKDCMAACVSPDAVQSWDLRCRVYNCFESLNPLAQKDHVAHCEHAGARGAGDTYAKCHVAGEPSER
jgi:hypothetical protein